MKFLCLNSVSYKKDDKDKSLSNLVYLIPDRNGNLQLETITLYNHLLLPGTFYDITFRPGSSFPVSSPVSLGQCESFSLLCGELA